MIWGAEMTGHSEKCKRLIQSLRLGGLVCLTLAWPAWSAGYQCPDSTGGFVTQPTPCATMDDFDTWRQTWFDYERDIRAWCTKWSPTSPERCIQQEMAKHGGSPAFFTKLRQPRDEPPPRIPALDTKAPDTGYFLRKEPQQHVPDRDKRDNEIALAIFYLVIFCGWVGFPHLRNYLRTRREIKARETMPCQHGVMGAGYDPTKCSACVREAMPCQHGVTGAVHDSTKCPACVREDQERREAARRQAQEEQERREAEQARQYAAWIARIRSQEYVPTMDPREFELLGTLEN
jgi:hypothetical protein